MSNDYLSENIYTSFKNGIKRKENEPLEIVVRKFKKEVIISSVLSEVKKRKYYEKPSIKRKKSRRTVRKVYDRDHNFQSGFNNSNNNYKNNKPTEKNTTKHAPKS